MKKYLKIFISTFTRFYIPSCIKGHTFLLNKIRNNSLILDIGMNQGEFTSIIKNRKNSIKVSGIELDKSLSSKIINNKNINIYDKAITGHNGFTHVYKISHKFNYNYFGSLWSVINDPDWKIVKTKKIQCISLDKFIEESFNIFQISQIDLLKIDIEGAEIEALKSIKKQNLDKVRQITLEFHDFMFPGQMTNVIQTIKYLKDHNFYYYDFSLKEKYRDVLFVHKKTINKFRNFFLIFLSSNIIKKIVKKRKGIFKYTLFLYRDYLSD